MTVLVVAAHPDDEILGCGATIAKRAKAGDSVRVVTLGTGISARGESDPVTLIMEIARLREHCRSANAVVGAHGIVNGDFADNRFDSVDMLDLAQFVEHHITLWQPAVIYTHHAGDLNVDHRRTFQAVLTATRPMAGRSVRELYSFEVPSATEWAFGRIASPFQPTVFEDVTDTLDAKVQALQCYDTETRPFPHPRSPEALRAIATRWGSVVGVHAAEAFEAIRIVR